MKRLAIALLTAMLCCTAMAQDDLEYRWEIGAGAGILGYQGDFSTGLFSNVQPVGMVVLRRVINPYMALRAAVSYGKMKGSSKDVATYYSQYAGNEYTFDRTLGDLSITYEYNFWPYGTGRDYRGARRLVPFIFGGVGVSYAKGGEDNVFTANIPIGLGVKYKMNERINVGVEWAMHFSLSDKLDGVADPYGVKSSGMFKNTDCYHALMLTLTYSFSPKCTTCNKDF